MGGGWQVILWGRDASARAWGLASSRVAMMCLTPFARPLVPTPSRPYLISGSRSPLGFGISPATRNPPPENGNQLLGQHAVLPLPHASSPYLTELGFEIID